MPTPPPDDLQKRQWAFITSYVLCPACDALTHVDALKAHAEEHLNHPMIKRLKERKRDAASSD